MPIFTLACIPMYVAAGSAEATVRGVVKSAVFVVVLTRSYFDSPTCLLQLRAARSLGKTILIVR